MPPVDPRCEFGSLTRRRCPEPATVLVVFGPEPDARLAECAEHAAQTRRYVWCELRPLEASDARR